MTEQLVQLLAEFFGNTIPAELTIAIISMLPVLELRGGLIAATLLDVPFLRAFLICYLANLLPVPFIILFIRKIFGYLRRFRLFKRFIEKLEAKSEKRREKVMRYEAWGLLIFVAVPIPGTGGWTGALLAALFDLRLKKSLPIIALGVLIAGIIMAILTYGLPFIASQF